MLWQAKGAGAKSNRVFYLALPPSVFQVRLKGRNPYGPPLQFKKCGVSSLCTCLGALVAGPSST